LDDSKAAKKEEIIWPQCLPFRRRLHLPSVIADLLRDALIIGTGDSFRQIRAIDYALDAHTLAERLNSPVFGKGDCQRCVINELHELNGPIKAVLSIGSPHSKEPKLLENYRDIVRKKYQKTVPPSKRMTAN
jgi:hypothetical protein